jgi:hypothetical protein
MLSFTKILYNIKGGKRDTKIYPQERDVCESIYQYMNGKDPYAEYRKWLDSHEDKTTTTIKEYKIEKK